MNMPDSWFPDLLAGVASVSGTSATGKPTYPAATTGVYARVEYQSNVIRTPEGQELQSQTVVVSKTRAFVSRDRIWLPGTNIADPNAAKLAMHVDTQRDKYGRLVISRAFL